MPLLEKIRANFLQKVAMHFLINKKRYLNFWIKLFKEKNKLIQTFVCLDRIPKIMSYIFRNKYETIYRLLESIFMEKTKFMHAVFATKKFRFNLNLEEKHQNARNIYTI